MAEIAPVIQRALKSAEQVENWAADEVLELEGAQKGWQARVEKKAKGVALIIS